MRVYAQGAGRFHCEHSAVWNDLRDRAVRLLTLVAHGNCAQQVQLVLSLLRLGWPKSGVKTDPSAASTSRLFLAQATGV